MASSLILPNMSGAYLLRRVHEELVDEPCLEGLKHHVSEKIVVEQIIRDAFVSVEQPQGVIGRVLGQVVAAHPEILHKELGLDILVPVRDDVRRKKRENLFQLSGALGNGLEGGLLD